MSRQEEETAPLLDEAVINTAAGIEVLPGGVMNPVVVNIIVEEGDVVLLSATTTVREGTVETRTVSTRMSTEGVLVEGAEKEEEGTPKQI